MVPAVKRFDVAYADFGEKTADGVQCGVRPALIISNNMCNKYSPAITVVPLTKQLKNINQPTHVLLSKGSYGLTYDSMLLGEQITTVNKDSILDIVGSVRDSHTRDDIINAVNTQIGIRKDQNILKIVTYLTDMGFDRLSEVKAVFEVA